MVIIKMALLVQRSVALRKVALCVDVIGEHQYEMLDYVAAKFHEELGVFKLLVMIMIMIIIQ